MLNEWLSRLRPLNWLHLATWLHLLEDPLKRLLNTALDGRHVPLVIPIEIPAGTYESGLWLPEIRLGERRFKRFEPILSLFAQGDAGLMAPIPEPPLCPSRSIDLTRSGRLEVTGVEVAVVDGILEQVANAVKAQLLPADYDWREEDPRLTDFTEPINLHFRVKLRWGREDKLYIELKDLAAARSQIDVSNILE